VKELQITVVLVTLFLPVIAGWHIIVVRSYTNAGYTKGTVQGDSKVHWIKPVAAATNCPCAR
jgi:hypothetical protein